ncbi:SWIM zinc finger family protein [Microbispora rosea]|uniref:SWIM zinc finger family protein n=1 Tax=Microbispora rosea TaxID=58117 RepID=UPI0004C38053|nr:SWIM zinc finger family protein [Microbispora rosea]
MPVGRDGWFEAARPIRVEGGIKARSKRGTIGEQWWSRRFVDVLERVCDAGRLSRGRAYARRGQVLDLDLGPGLVKARVQGSRPDPYGVSVRITAYGEREWAGLVEALAAQALHRAKLLAGEMPPEIEQVFEACGLPLFPGERGLDMDCSCPDWGFPCKHLSAVLYLLAEAFDDDPFLVLAWRGMAREALLDALRATGGDGGRIAAEPGGGGTPDLLGVPDVPFAERMGDFYESGASAARLGPPADPGSPPDLLLRALDPPQVKARHIPLLDLLRPAYRTLAAGESDEAEGVSRDLLP